MGLGSLDLIKNVQEQEKMKKFYFDLGGVAKEKGIVVSLITFEGEESKISVLASLIEQTGGTISRVHPNKILEEFSNLLSTEVIATDVKLKVKLHQTLCFRNENINNLTLNQSTLVKSIGNATNETETYFEYHFKDSEEIAKLEDINLAALKDVPFQAMIEYTSKKGERCIRVLTKKLEISSDKKEIEKQANYNILSVNAIQKSSQLARDGDFRGAQAHASAWKSVLKKGNKEDYHVFKDNFTGLNNNLLEIQSKEVDRGVKGLVKNVKEERLLNVQDNFSSLVSPNVNISQKRAYKKK